MAMEDIMKALMEGASGAQQQQQQSGGGDALSQVLGGLLGGGQQGAGAPGVQMLGALEQIIGGQPGTGQPLNANQGTSMNMNMNDPIMLLLQPVVNQLAAKANISPQIAMVVASIAVHYLLSSHPSTPGTGRLDLGSVMQQLSTGKISQDTLRDSGMVDDVMQATGLSKPQAVKSLNATFGALGARAKGTVGGGRTT